MSQVDQDPVLEPSLHALVDGQLTRRKARAVQARLATRPAAAEQIAILAEQRAELAALREVLTVAVEPSPAELAGLEDALHRKLRRQRQVQRILTVCGVALAAGTTAASWRAIRTRCSHQPAAAGRDAMVPHAG